MHRDSVGSEQPIRPGEVNWMTAGRGITHSERFERARREGGRDGRHPGVGGAAGGARGDRRPRSPTMAADDCRSYDERAGYAARLIAGEAFGASAAVETHSPLFYVHWRADGGRASASFPRVSRARRLCRRRIGRSRTGTTFDAGQMLVFDAGRSRCCSRAITPAVVMLLGGEPVGARFIEWNFVSSSKERIEQAKADWRAGRMKLPDLDNAGIHSPATRAGVCLNPACLVAAAGWGRYRSRAREARPVAAVYARPMSNSRIEVVEGDITTLDGRRDRQRREQHAARRRRGRWRDPSRGGPELWACRALRETRRASCRTGEAKITPGSRCRRAT